MENSKKFLKEGGILPKISFVPGEPRILKIIDDKIDTVPDTRGGMVKGMKYKVMENGEVKTFFTSSVVLIGKLAEIDPDSFVKIEQKKIKAGSELRTTYKVTKMKETGEEAGEVSSEMPKAEDIPIIEEDGDGGYLTKNEEQQEIPPNSESDSDF